MNLASIRADGMHKSYLLNYKGRAQVLTIKFSAKFRSWIIVFLCNANFTFQHRFFRLPCDKSFAVDQVDVEIRPDQVKVGVWHSLDVDLLNQAIRRNLKDLIFPSSSFLGHKLCFKVIMKRVAPLFPSKDKARVQVTWNFQFERKTELSKWGLPFLLHQRHFMFAGFLSLEFSFWWCLLRTKTLLCKLLRHKRIIYPTFLLFFVQNLANLFDSNEKNYKLSSLEWFQSLHKYCAGEH